MENNKWRVKKLAAELRYFTAHEKQRIEKPAAVSLDNLDDFQDILAKKGSQVQKEVSC